MNRIRTFLARQHACAAQIQQQQTATVNTYDNTRHNRQLRQAIDRAGYADQYVHIYVPPWQSWRTRLCTTAHSSRASRPQCLIVFWLLIRHQPQAAWNLPACNQKSLAPEPQPPTLYPHAAGLSGNTGFPAPLDVFIRCRAGFAACHLTRPKRRRRLITVDSRNMRVTDAPRRIQAPHNRPHLARAFCGWSAGCP